MADICFVTKTWRYSVPWIVHSLAKALTDEGRSVCVIAPCCEPRSREVHSPLLTRIFLPREIITSCSAPRRFIASIRRILNGLAATLYERRRTLTFLVTIPDPLIVSLPMFLLLRLSGARVLFMVHDAVPHVWRLPRKLRWAERAAHRLSYRLASELIILTNSLRRPLEQEFGIPAERIICIPHGPLQLGELPPPLGTGRLLQFGSVRSNKSVLKVIEGTILARRSGLPVTLVIAGEPHPSESEYWQCCTDAIARDPAGFDIRKGFLAEDDLPNVIADVDAFVLAYVRFDSQSGVGMLAALSQRPVLCTQAGGLSDLIAGGLCHQLIDQPVTAESVAEAITAFYAKPFVQWREAARASSAHFTKTQSWANVAARLSERIWIPHAANGPVVTESSKPS